jgi:amino-acid N-acetyltransferase
VNAPVAASPRLMISARPALRASVALLDSVGLLASDLTHGHLEHFFYCGAREAPTGLVGVELYGSNALLRSLVVALSARDSGVGSTLVKHAENYARSQGVHAMYLLTMTAEGFSRNAATSASLERRPCPRYK